jgi:hypothetical protein
MEFRWIVIHHIFTLSFLEIDHMTCSMEAVAIYVERETERDADETRCFDIYSCWPLLF